MKAINRILPVIFVLASFENLYAQNKKEIAVSAKKDTIKSKTLTTTKEDGNRNVMLNAANNTSPRDVNIGLPASV
ncbi:hypothetical protein CMU93_08960, partial [Elizabethkingia anophelis]|nr:hypothetical protein [Elizabethkingia anophelis]